MKKLFLSIVALAVMSLSFSAFAQSPTDDLFEDYGAKDGFTTVHITKELFSLFAEIANEADSEEAKEVQEVVNGLDYIRILMCDASDSLNTDVLVDFKHDLNKVKLNGFTELMTVKEGKELVKFMIMKDGKKITELLVIINQSDQAGFISITGNIDLKSIAKLSQSMDIDGLENLEKLND